MANPWKILTTLTASSDALFEKNVNLGNNSADIITIAGQLTASANALFSGDVNVNGNTTLGNTSTDIVTLTGQTTASNGLYVNGGMTVNGDLTYINTTNLNVTDKKITIANGAADVGVNGAAGVYVGSDSAPLASLYATGSTAGWHISGAAGVYIAATSSADMTNIGAGTVTNGEINLESTFRAINSALATSGLTIGTVRTEYDKLRFLQTGSLSSGQAIVSLNKNAFVNANKDFVVLDVMVRETNLLSWTNDLVSVYMQTGSTYLDVTIDAPGISGGAWEYKLVAVNENTGSLGLIA